MASEAVQPLRIQKSNASSPSKTPSTKMSQPLSEINPMGIRRNSPSFNQATKKQAFAGDSSPFDASSSNNSPIHFWKGRQSVSPSRMGASENSPNFSASSEKRRVSIEKLQKASRVKNSTMFARESSQIYDPEAPAFIERPLASGRPLGLQHQGNAFAGKGFESPTGKTSPSRHRRGESNHSIDFRSPTKATSEIDDVEPQLPQPLSQGSPQKSSLSNNSRFSQHTKFDPEAGTWSDDEATATLRPGPSPRSSARHPKTVSFDAAPPQVNEYEMITPDPSSAASGSREGSYESDSFDMDAHFDDLVPAERDDSFDDSLEDADKTPVVLPEDWRFMSPEVAKTDLADTFEDPFEEGSPDPHSNRRNSMQTRQFLLSRNDSINSDGERRPLPPLPGVFSGTSHERQASDSQAGPGRRSISPHVPGATHPRPASLSKTDILEMKSSSTMPLEERLRLLAVQEGEKNQYIVESQRYGEQEGGPDFQGSEEEVIGHPDQSADVDSKTEEPSNVEAKRHAPKISRESILRRVKSQHLTDSDGDTSIPSSPVHQKIFEEYANLDPDVPIPSREPSSNYDEDQMDAEIKQEEDDNQPRLDPYAYPELEGFENHASSEPDDAGRESSVVRHTIPDDDVSSLLDEDVGQDDENVELSGIDDKVGSDGSYDDTTVQALEPSLAARLEHERQQQQDFETQKRMSLPEFTAFGEKDDFNLSLKSYMTPSPPVVENITPDKTEQEARRKSDDSQEIPRSNEREFQHHEPVSEPVSKTVSNESPEAANEPISVTPPSLDTDLPESEPHEVPGRVATVKAPGSKLKVRRSGTAAELEGLNEGIQYTSDEKPPPIPEQFRAQGVGSRMEERSETNSFQESEKPGTDANHEGLSMTLELNDFNNDDGLGIDQEFDRLLEAQKVKDLFPIPARAVLPLPLKYSDNADYIPGQGFFYQNIEANPYLKRQRGYLMRQNTKVVVAKRNVSNETKSSDGSRNVSGQIARPRETKSAGNSPRKASTAYTKEPWNGKQRRQSTRRSNIGPEKGLPAPPISSTATEEAQMSGLTEDSASMAEEIGAGVDRGRFFVKVCAVKDLDLPLPRNERSWFQLTLDNGLHCVTTAWLELGKTAPIGQEFELTVFDELDFSLTLQTKLERPQSQASTIGSFESPTKPAKQAKGSAFSRFLTSPKKRKELEKKQAEEEALVAHQRRQEMEAQRANIEPTAWDLLHNLVGPDGSFARSVVSLQDHENKAFGRPYMVDVPCFNSWATEDSATSSSTRSKHGGVQRKPPYKIGKLELQLLFVPKLKGMKDDDMPQSMSACIKQMKEAEASSARQHEGYLSQQGADCPHWRRRQFRLQGNQLTAYHEVTKQRRFNINLGKPGTKLVDENSNLKQVGEKNRRKSAFAQDEEGYMFLPEGFRLRFGNGETIDFYADTVPQKDEWVKMISEAVGKDAAAEKTSWTGLVLAKERADAAKKAAPPSPTRQGKPHVPPPQPSRSLPNSPQKGMRPKSTMMERPPPPPVEKPPARQNPNGSPQKRRENVQTANNNQNTGSDRSDRRRGVRSMIF